MKDTIMTIINQQTPGPLHIEPSQATAGETTLLIAPDTFQVCEINSPAWDGNADFEYPCDPHNARLIAASYTAFDKAGRALEIDATELAGRIDLVAAYHALELVRTMARMIKDGDVIDGSEFSADGNDDDVDALYALISDARELVADRPDGLEE